MIVIIIVDIATKKFSLVLKILQKRWLGML